MYSLVNLSQSTDIFDLRQARWLTCIHVQMEPLKGYTGRPELIKKRPKTGSQLYMNTYS